MLKKQILHYFAQVIKETGFIFLRIENQKKKNKNKNVIKIEIFLMKNHLIRKFKVKNKVT